MKSLLSMGFSKELLGTYHSAARPDALGPRLAVLALWLCGNHQLQGKAGGSRAPLRPRHASEASGWNAAPAVLTSAALLWECSSHSLRAVLPRAGLGQSLGHPSAR